MNIFIIYIIIYIYKKYIHAFLSLWYATYCKMSGCCDLSLVLAIFHNQRFPGFQPSCWPLQHEPRGTGEMLLADKQSSCHVQIFLLLQLKGDQFVSKLDQQSVHADPRYIVPCALCRIFSSAGSSGTCKLAFSLTPAAATFFSIWLRTDSSKSMQKSW